MKETLYATFSLGSSLEFAISIHQVREATVYTGEVVEIPSSPDYVDGVFNLRGELIPIVNLKKRLNLHPVEYAKDCKVAILEVGGLTYGVLFDGIKDVLRIDEEEVADLSSEMLSGHEGLVKGVASKNNGERILQIVDFSILLGGQLEESRLAPSSIPASPQSEEKTDRLVVFEHCSREYGLSIQHVREIADATDLDDTFKTGHIQGTMPLHGTPIPVLDLGGLLRSPVGTEKEATQPTKLLVVEMDGTAFGTLVDDVKEILSFRESDLKPVPLKKGDTVNGIVHPTDTRNIIVLDCCRVFAEVVDATASVAALGKAGTKKTSDKQDDDENHFITGNSYLVVKVARSFAIPLSRIQEILPARDVLPIPELNGFHKGVINLRGAVVPVISMRSYFGYPPSIQAGEDRLVIARHDDMMMALMVDGIETIMNRHKTFQTPTLNDQLRHRLKTLDKLIKHREENGASILVMNVPSLMEDAAIAAN